MGTLYAATLGQSPGIYVHKYISIYIYTYGHETALKIDVFQKWRPNKAPKLFYFLVNPCMVLGVPKSRKHPNNDVELPRNLQAGTIYPPVEMGVLISNNQALSTRWTCVSPTKFGDFNSKLLATATQGLWYSRFEVGWPAESELVDSSVGGTNCNGTSQEPVRIHG